MSITEAGVPSREQNGFPQQRQEFYSALFRCDDDTKMYAMQAYDFSEKAHAGTKRKYGGGRFFVHPRGVALTLIRLGETDGDIIAGALLHDTVEDTNAFGEKNDTFTDTEERRYAREEIERLGFTARTATVILALTKPKIDGREVTSGRDRDERYYNQLPQAIRDDPKIGLIKMADVLYNTTTAKRLRPEKKKRLLLEIQDHYLPIFAMLFNAPYQIRSMAILLMSDIGEAMNDLAIR